MRINETTKRTKLLIINVLSCTFLMAQQSQISDFVHIDFPARTVKFSKAELNAMIDDKKKDSLLIPIDTERRDYYSIDSVLINLHGQRWIAPENYLEKSRRDFEIISTTEMSCNCTSEIKKINNYRALITNIDSKDWGVYFFYSVNSKNSAVLNGSLVYLKYLNGNRAKASKALNELLDNIAYKF